VRIVTGTMLLSCMRAPCEGRDYKASRALASRIGGATPGCAADHA
jgi:hypothetical protein